MSADTPWNERPPDMVKILTMLRIVLLQIDSLKFEVLALPAAERAPLRIELLSLEQKARHLRAAAHRASVSH